MLPQETPAEIIFVVHNASFNLTLKVLSVKYYTIFSHFQHLLKMFELGFEPWPHV